MERAAKYYIDVSIQERNFCENDKKPMTEENFKNCVDDKIQQDFRQNNVECVPPWLSYNNQCNLTYPENFYGDFKNAFDENYIEMVQILSNIKFEEDCRKSCRRKTYIVYEKGIKEKQIMHEALNSFQSKVLVTE